MTESRTLEELERMYSVEKRNSTVYRQTLEQIVTYAGKAALAMRGSHITSYLLHIQNLAQTAMTNTGEIPRDGFKR